MASGIKDMKKLEAVEKKTTMAKKMGHVATASDRKKDSYLSADSIVYKKPYISPTGSKHRVGSQKSKYWEDIKKRGEADKKYGAGD